MGISKQEVIKAIDKRMPMDAKAIHLLNSIIKDIEMLPEESAIKIDLDNGTKLVAETGFVDYNEIYVFIEDKDGLAKQDLAIVGQEFVYGEDDKVINKDGQFSVKVYEDETNENWTEDFHILEYREEDEDA